MSSQTWSLSACFYQIHVWSKAASEDISCDNWGFSSQWLAPAAALSAFSFEQQVCGWGVCLLHVLMQLCMCFYSHLNRVACQFIVQTNPLANSSFLQHVLSASQSPQLGTRWKINLPTWVCSWAFNTSTLFWEGFLQDFETWPAELTPIQPQKHQWSCDLMLGDMARLAV